MAHRGILIGAATRPHPNEVVNGDVWHVDWTATGCRLAVIDGLGHGPEAASAAMRAREVLAGSPDVSPGEVLRLCHEALHRTRGAAIGIATIEPEIGRLTFAGVGNVEARLVAAGRAQHLPSSRGIVGAVLPTIRPVDVDLTPGWRFLIHSDGISDRFDLDEVTGSDAPDLQHLADLILDRYGRATDDATVLLACPISP